MGIWEGFSYFSDSVILYRGTRFSREQVLVVGKQLDWMFLEVFSNLGDSVISLLFEI